MNGLCGANCSDCELLKNKKCKGCKNTNGCPFGSKCWIANYIEMGGKDSFDIKIVNLNQIVHSMKELNEAVMDHHLL